MDLTGKVAVVTGSGRGPGLAYATELARSGAAVVHDDVDGEVAGTAARTITDAGGSAVAEVVAVGTSEAAQVLVDGALSEFGRLDVLVDDAGILRDATHWKMTDEQFDSDASTHLRGTFTRTRAGLTVNAIVPVAATAMTETVRYLEPYVDALRPRDPLPPFARQQLGFGTSEDAAGLVPFLASDAAAGITGQAIGIGGDRLAPWSHPAVAVVEFADGTGWSADAPAAIWSGTFAPAHRTVGRQFPEPLK